MIEAFSQWIINEIQQAMVSPVAKIGELLGVQECKRFSSMYFFVDNGITWICHLGKYRVIKSS